MNETVDLFFPRHCPMCDRVMKHVQKLVCEECIPNIHYVEEPVCVKCGKHLYEQEEEYCYDCSRKKHFFVKGRALFEYNCIAASVYRFKYGDRREYAEFYGKCMAQKFRKLLEGWQPEAIVPVPIHPSRMKKRGYNQAELLAKVISRECGIPLRTDILQRCRKTIPQKNLNEQQRQNNLKKAFKMRRNDVKLNTIVIIDDIYTTGNTIDAMAHEMQKAGVSQIYYLTLAIGRGL